MALAVHPVVRDDHEPSRSVRLGLSISAVGVLLAAWMLVVGLEHTYHTSEGVSTVRKPAPIAWLPLFFFAVMALGFGQRLTIMVAVGLLGAAAFSAILFFSYGIWFVLPTLAGAAALWQLWRIKGPGAEASR